MVACPGCNADIDQVVAYVLEENKYLVDLDPFQKAFPNLLRWHSDESPVEGTAKWIVYSCPECKKVLFKENGEKSTETILKFLSGEVKAVSGENGIEFVKV